MDNTDLMKASWWHAVLSKEGLEPLQEDETVREDQYSLATDGEASVSREKQKQ